MRRAHYLKGLLLAGLLLMMASAPVPARSQDQSDVGIRFHFDTIRTMAEGSDNWPMTWADNGNQYTSWGDGEGFDGITRASLGVAEVTGGKDNYTGRNLWAGDGKSVGILAVGNTLYLLKSRSGSGEAAYEGVELLRSTDRGRTWSKVRDLDPGGTGGLFAATFLQAGQGYRSGPQTIYVYAPRKTRANNEWEVQKPGEIVLVELDRTTLREVSRQVVFTHPEGVLAHQRDLQPSARPLLSDDSAE